jgi:lysophospholipase
MDDNSADASITTTSLPVGSSTHLRVMTAAAASSALGTVVIATGRTEFCEKYFECIDTLRKLNFNCLVFDWRGQGLSSRSLRDRQKGHVSDYDEYIEDLDAVISHAIGLYETEEVYVLAHSMGGHIALRFLARRPGMIKAAVLSAPMIDICRNRIESFMLGGVSGLAVRCGAGDAYVVGKAGYSERDREFSRNNRTHDPDRFAVEVNAIAADPDLALGGPTWGWLRSTLRSIEALRAEASAGRITDPVLIVSAEADQIVSNEAQRALQKLMPNSEFASISGAYHEILQETPERRAQFWSKAGAFLTRHTGLKPLVAKE